MVLQLKGPKSEANQVRTGLALARKEVKLGEHAYTFSPFPQGQGLRAKRDRTRLNLCLHLRGINCVL